jgi:hypothetical protein
LHDAPTIAQVGVPFTHRLGVPAQVPAQHSSLVVQESPVATHADVQTETPASPASHVPLQQVSLASQGALRGRQGPGPKSHRPLVMSQFPQHWGNDTEEQYSPGVRHEAAARMQRPSALSHSPEQQSLSMVQGSPSTVHSVVPHTPLLHPREQQSDASEHGEPFTRQ